MLDWVQNTPLEKKVLTFLNSLTKFVIRYQKRIKKELSAKFGENSSTLQFCEQIRPNL